MTADVSRACGQSTTLMSCKLTLIFDRQTSQHLQNTMNYRQSVNVGQKGEKGGREAAAAAAFDADDSLDASSLRPSMAASMLTETAPVSLLFPMLDFRWQVAH